MTGLRAITNLPVPEGEFLPSPRRLICKSGIVLLIEQQAILSINLSTQFKAHIKGRGHSNSAEVTDDRPMFEIGHEKFSSFLRPRAVTYLPDICFVPLTHTPTLGCDSPLQNLLSNLQAPNITAKPPIQNITDEALSLPVPLPLAVSPLEVSAGLVGCGDVSLLFDKGLRSLASRSIAAILNRRR